MRHWQAVSKRRKYPTRGVGHSVRETGITPVQSCWQTFAQGIREAGVVMRGLARSFGLCLLSDHEGSIEDRDTFVPGKVVDRAIGQLQCAAVLAEIFQLVAFIQNE